jgi:hypothetical protein
MLQLDQPMYGLAARLEVASAVSAAEAAAAVVEATATAWPAAGTAAATPAVTARTSIARRVRRGKPGRAPRRALYGDDRMGRLLR